MLGLIFSTPSTRNVLLTVRIPGAISAKTPLASICRSLAACSLVWVSSKF